MVSLPFSHTKSLGLVQIFIILTALRLKSKRVTSGGAYLIGLTPDQHRSYKTSQQWRAVYDAVRKTEIDCLADPADDDS